MMISNSLRWGMTVLLGLGLLTAQAQTPSSVSYAQREAALTPELKQQLTLMRTEITKKNYSYTVGATEVLDKPDSQLFGETLLPNINEVARQQAPVAQKMLERDKAAREKAIQDNPALGAQLHEYNNPTNLILPRWDWRSGGKVTAVRRQNPAATCWAFSAIGALESSWSIRNNRIIDASEQFLVSYGGSGTITGGNSILAAQSLTQLGTVEETICPYTATNTTSTPKDIFRPYRALTWGLVDPIAPASVPSVQKLKEALLQYGPFVVSVYADSNLKSYTGGVFDHESTHATNHSVLVIGWDDSKGCWIIKNSWGSGWGESCGYGSTGGYGYIKYGHHSIGQGAFWLVAFSIHFPIYPQ